MVTKAHDERAESGVTVKESLARTWRRVRGRATGGRQQLKEQRRIVEVRKKEM